MQCAVIGTLNKISDDDVIAGLEELHDRVDAAHAGGEGEAVGRTLERGDVPLERLARRILAPGVLVPLVFAECVLYVRGSEVHRRHDRAGERFGTLAGMDRPGAERRLQIVIVDAGHARR